MKINTKLPVIAGALFVVTTSYAQVGVDGLLGAEWSGETPVSVGYDSGAPLGNFGAPSNVNHLVGYDVYTRSDSLFFYALIKATPVSGDQWDTARGTAAFANLYFDLNPGTGSDLGFEVTNDRAFIPGSPGYYTAGLGPGNYAWALDLGTDSSNGNVGGGIEVAISWNYFLTDPAGMGFAPPTSAVQLRLSQSWGYSVAGGSSYGATRLGQEAVPEPATMSLLALAGIGALRKRFKKS